ncbi:unnamed protein product [Anisakis simplex]|uniref:P53 domain-containing protein n=1 Tax=Anisakis simplex TaxID=6269 RepID=A0A0M3J7H0_ANISI|nr:unnamed protein product [Anisakis simplex]
MIREHFIQCEHQSAVYVNCATPNDPSFIMLPLNELFSSLSPLFIPLKFTCFSSCTGGINRRAVHISFVLKSNEQIIGSDVISLKVCACPSRDATLEGYEPRRKFLFYYCFIGFSYMCMMIIIETAKKRRTVLSKRPTEVITKTICTESEKKDATDRFREDEDTIYEVQVRGRHLYKLVCSIIANYELSRRYLKEKNGLDDGDDKLDTLKSPSTPLTNRTAIKTWLANLDLSKYEGAFTSKCLFVIDDLEGVINRKFLLSIGVKEEEIGLILESYLSWYDVYNAQRQSSLSSHSSTIRIQRTRVRSSTLHLD